MDEIKKLCENFMDGLITADEFTDRLISQEGKMYFICCRFKKSEKSETLNGYAVCSDPDTPITFICPNGEPYVGAVWTYSLQHHKPWAKLNN